MSVIKEFRCAEHGPFECSDAICPEMGCCSQDVVREFRTAPGVRSGMVAQHERGIRELSDRMGGANFRNAKEGEASFGGDKSGGLLWGNDASKFLGHPITEKTVATNAMRSDAAVATRVDFSGHNLRPPAQDIIQHKNEAFDRKKVAAA